MNGYRFYKEYTDKSRQFETGNIVAIEWKYRRWDQHAGCMVYDGVASVLNYPNNAVTSAGVAETYLALYCRRVSEDTARALHPRLFDYLEAACEQAS